MAYTTIDDGSEYFNTVLWTGDASSDKSISGVGFQPDWVWAKNRSDANDHQIIDSSRGAGKILRTNSTGAELTRSVDVGAGGLQNFESDGFDVHSTSTNTNLNDNGELNVGWCWKANGGTTSSNSDGSITSTVQANTTAGFSIVTYTGNGTSGATIGHGLNSAPEWTIIKRRSDTEAWPVWHTAFGSAQSNVRLNGTDVVDTSSSAMFNNTFPTSSLITLGNGNFVNTNTETYVAYCFSEVKGYSKFGSYTGNNSTDGVFIYTGFKPAWLMVKKTDGTANWDITTAAISQNQIDERLRANLSNAEESSGYVDFLSNGFKMRNTNGSQNNGSYIYMAFAEHPFVSSKGVPVTAR
jgi:hypothetical protein